MLRITHRKKKAWFRTDPGFLFLHNFITLCNFKRNPPEDSLKKRRESKILMYLCMKINLILKKTLTYDA